MDSNRFSAEKCCFVNRDISWLEFNSRVLDEAMDRGNPLLERLKFLSIFSSNLDEFFMVRIAGIAQQAASGNRKQEIYKDYFYDPVELLERLDLKIRLLVEKQYRYLVREVLPEMARQGITLAAWDDLTPEQQNEGRHVLEKEILPVLTPIGIDLSHPFPFVQNLSLELLIRLHRHTESGERFAILEVPSVIPRFVQLSSDRGLLYIASEDLIAHNLQFLFSGCEILECTPFRVTRDMDFSIDEESIADLLSEMQIALQRKAKRSIVRLEVSSGISRKSKNWLTGKLNIREEEVYLIHGPLNLKAMFQLSGVSQYPALVNEPMPPLSSIHCDEKKSMFETIRSEGSFIIHLPYESFNPVVRLLEEAADDPDVLAIKQTLYRVSGNSPIVHALIRAARNGKQVSVLFEIKARFDEENNINWSRELAEAGAHVVYGIAGLKVHCKALMIIRREEDSIHRYVHLSTGNYNDKTARQYTDIGYFSDDKLLASDVAALFNVITGFSDPPLWNQLTVAPFNLREKLIFMIDREAKLSTPENPGHITMKVNALIDYEVIEHLYEAARKSVKIDLIVRGICGVNPFAFGKEVTKNFHIVSILDRFLEHSRIYIFKNNGSPEYFMGSADVMPRNIRKRIELLFPVDSEEIRAELDRVVRLALNDRRKGRRMIAENTYSKTNQPRSAAYEKSRSQTSLYEFYKKRFAKYKESTRPGKGKLVVYKKRDTTQTK